MISMFSKAYYQDRWEGGSLQRTRSKALFRHHRHRRAQQSGAGKHKLCNILNKTMPAACSDTAVAILIFGKTVLYNTTLSDFFVHIIKLTFKLYIVTWKTSMVM